MTAPIAHRAAPLDWNLTGGLRASFSSIEDGDLRREDLREAWRARVGLARLVVPGQVHGAQVVDATATPGALAVADGVVTDDPRLPLGVFGADCPGLCVWSGDAQGVAHCGWRGVAAGIVTRLARELAARTSEPPRRWRAFVGPGIGGASYEVDAPVLSARAWPPTALTPRQGGRALLDLAAAIVADLAACGVTDVTTSGVCTRADPRLRSYRWDGPGLTQLLAVWRA